MQRPSLCCNPVSREKQKERCSPSNGGHSHTCAPPLIYLSSVGPNSHTHTYRNTYKCTYTHTCTGSPAATLLAAACQPCHLRACKLSFFSGAKLDRPAAPPSRTAQPCLNSRCVCVCVCVCTLCTRVRVRAPLFLPLCVKCVLVESCHQYGCIILCVCVCVCVCVCMQP
jgi:hypothetical protein